MSVNTILVAHDGSEGAAHALAWAVGLARQIGRPPRGGPRVVAARRPRQAPRPRRLPPMHEEALAELRASGAPTPSPPGSRSTPASWRTCPSPGSSRPPGTPDADLIVCGTRGLGRVKELVLGSVARELPEKSHLPVTIVPPR